MESRALSDAPTEVVIMGKAEKFLDQIQDHLDPDETVQAWVAGQYERRSWAPTASARESWWPQNAESCSMPRS